MREVALSQQGFATEEEVIAALERVRSYEGLTFLRVRDEAPDLMRIRAVQYKALQEGANRTATAHLVVQMIRCVLENPGIDGIGKEPIRRYLKIMLNVGQKHGPTWEQRQRKIYDEMGLSPNNTTRHKLYKIGIPTLSAVLVKLDDWPCSASDSKSEAQADAGGTDYLIYALWQSEVDKGHTPKAASENIRRRLERLPAYVAMLPEEVAHEAEALNIAYQYVIQYHYPKTPNAKRLGGIVSSGVLPRSFAAELVHTLLFGNRAALQRFRRKVAASLRKEPARRHPPRTSFGVSRRNAGGPTDILERTLQAIESRASRVEAAGLWDPDKLQNVLERERHAARGSGMSDEGETGPASE